MGQEKYPGTLVSDKKACFPTVFFVLCIEDIKSPKAAMPQLQNLFAVLPQFPTLYVHGRER